MLVSVKNIYTIRQLSKRKDLQGPEDAQAKGMKRTMTGKAFALVLAPSILDKVIFRRGDCPADLLQMQRCSQSLRSGLDGGCTWGCCPVLISSHSLELGVEP